MDFSLTEEQTLFQDSVLKFAESELAKDKVARANAGDYPWDVAKRMAEIGLLGITIPEEKGGQGGSLIDAILAIQAVTAACPRSADVVQAGNFGAIRTFAEYASDAQRQRFLPDLLAGKAVMSVGMSEPEAGSAVTELRTRAEARRRVLSGQRRQGVRNQQWRGERLPHLRSFWPRCERHRLDIDRARNTRLRDRQAVAVHERRGVVATLLHGLQGAG